MKRYKSILESKYRSPMDNYITPLIDLGFKLSINRESDEKLFLMLNPHIDLTLKDKLEIFNEYLTLLDRVKEDFHISNHSIHFNSDRDVKIYITRKYNHENLPKELGMNKEVELAYNSILSSIGENDTLSLESFKEVGVNIHDYKVYTFNLEEGSPNLGSFSSKWSWISILDDGRVILPILRGIKSQNATTLPFTERDINWFKRILWVDQGDNHRIESEEFNILHKKSQKELRDIYN